MNDRDLKQIKDILRAVAADRTLVKLNYHAEQIYNLMDQRIRNQLVNDFRDNFRCPICGNDTPKLW